MAQTAHARTSSRPETPYRRPPERLRRSLRTRELFAAMAVASGDEQQDLRAAVIDLHLDLTHGLAGRYHSRGVPLEDLRQVAALALVKATQRYDVTAGFDFDSFAVPTIRGELRHTSATTAG